MTYSFLLPVINWFLILTAPREITISNPQFTGAVPRLTTDASSNPLVSWVEKDGDKKALFYFAVSKDGGQTFGPKIQVKAPTTISSHAEGMPKIAVKADGTILAIFEVPQPTDESRFAGDLLYTMSTDNGKTWSAPKSVHWDTSPGKNHRPTTRSFADITRLPNGEIGAVWLDEKLSGREGRPVVFAQTTKGSGFAPAVLVDDNACQCCRTNVFVDDQNRIHLTYRDLLPNKPGEVASRDISTVVSTDGGKTFSKPQAVLADNWQVNACPHAGPVVAQVGNEILATWFSGKENAVGLRLASINSNKLVSSVVSDRARHPQLSSDGKRLVWVWDESISKDGSGEMGSFVQRIGMRTFDGTQCSSIMYLTPESVDATYPAVLMTTKGTLVAYERTSGKSHPEITVRLLTN